MYVFINHSWVIIGTKYVAVVTGKKKRVEQKRVKWKGDVKGQINKMLLTLAVGL